MSSMDTEQHTMTGGVGSYLYMAPEVVRYEEYNEKADEDCMLNTATGTCLAWPGQLPKAGLESDLKEGSR